LGDAGGVAPVTARDASTVGRTATLNRVLSFSEKRLLTEFRSQDWKLRETQEVYEFLGALKNAPTKEPEGLRSQPLPQEQYWLQRYPAWFTPFRAGELFDCQDVWEQTFNAHNEPLPGTLQKWMTKGYSVWLNIKAFGKQPGMNQLSPEELKFALQQAQEWVLMGALDEVNKPARDVLVCNVVVAYRSGKMDRVCWAGNAINEGVTANPFKMESLRSVARLMQPGDWMFSFDLKKGYFQIPLKPAFKEFTYMRIGEKYYRWNVLMFGLASAPKDFSFIIKKVLGLLRKQGIRCSFFIDDIIFFARSERDAERLRLVALDLFYKLGFRVSWPKSLLRPGRIIRHLGLDVCSTDGSIWAPEDKVMRLKQLAAELLQTCTQPCVGRAVATFVGVLGALRLAIPAALILARGLMRSLDQLPILYTQEVDGKVQEVRDYKATVLLSPLAIAELRLWVEGSWKIRGSKVKQMTHTACFVDACPEGAGAVVARRLPGGAGEEWDIEQLRAGAWEGRISEQSSVFELLNVWNVVEEFHTSWRGNLVQICSDNVGAVFIMGRGCMKNHCLHALSLGIWRVCWQWDISLCAQYIGGDGIIAAGADGLSRDSDYGDCRLKTEVFNQLWDRWRMEVDLFCSPSATQRNPQTGELLWAVSPYKCERRIGVDGLTFRSTKVLYAFPPTALLPALVPRVVALGLRVVLIIPVWTQAEWWPLVCALPTVSCGKVRHSVVAGEANLSHPFGPSFRLDQALETEIQAKAFNL
jgi:Reverse transcriptase (RNA-dependent DNA polymerase)